VSNTVSTPRCYQIQIRGQLDPRWSAWFNGWTIAHNADGTTTLCGLALDQAALYGQIAKLRDLGLTLLAVTPCQPPPDAAAGTQDTAPQG
jgi:hypothetical protein